MGMAAPPSNAPDRVGDVSPSVGAAPAECPTGLDHFLQANRMRMNCTNAIDYGLFTQERSKTAKKVLSPGECWAVGSVLIGQFIISGEDLYDY